MLPANKASFQITLQGKVKLFLLQFVSAMKQINFVLDVIMGLYM